MELTIIAIAISIMFENLDLVVKPFDGLVT